MTKARELTLPQRALDIILHTGCDQAEVSRAAKIIAADELRTFAGGLQQLMAYAQAVDPLASSYGNAVLGISSDLARRANELDPDYTPQKADADGSA